jgi:hypothetical protein
MATHNYTRQIQDDHYVIEAAIAAPEDNHRDRFTMTAYGTRIRAGDFILLRQNGERVRYQVEQIDYYCDQPDLWTALLVKLES